MYYETKTVEHPHNPAKTIEVKIFQKAKAIKHAAIGIALLTTALVLNPFHTVPTGSRGVVTQFGKIINIEDEGLAVLPPWRKLQNFSIRAEQVDIQSAEGATSDTQPVHVNMTVRYSVQPDKVAEVYEKYSHTGDLSNYVFTAAAEGFKSVTAQYSATDLISKRAQVSSDVRQALAGRMAQYGAQVISIDITAFAFSQSYMAAINEKVTQEQLRQAAENKLKTVEAEQKQKIAVAEAEAKATVVTAEAQATSIRVQAQAMRESTNLVELKRVEVEMEKAKKWDGKLPVNMYANAPMPYMNVGK
jgi:prohibitin 2